MANGDITYTQNNCSLDVSAFACGTYVGSGAAINIILGFVPSMIQIFNDTDDTEFLWFRGVAAGSMFQRVAAGDRTLVTGGPTLYGDTSDDGNPPQDAYESHSETGQGFTIPAAATALNTAADACYWVAWR